MEVSVVSRESRITNLLDAIRNSDGLKRYAFSEIPITNCSNAIRNVYGCKGKPHSAKASVRISVTLSGIVMDVREVHSAKA